MAFKVGDLLIDRVLIAYAYTLGGQPLFYLTQLNSFEVSFSSDTNDMSDNSGTLVKRTFRNRTADVTATNAMFNLPIVATMGGTDPETATADKTIDMPRILTTTETTVELPGLTSASESNLKVTAIGTNGLMGNSYNLGTSGTEKGTFTFSDGKLTINANDGDTKWAIYYIRQSDNGTKITVSGNKFPKTISIIARALAYDVCSVDTPRSVYIEIPSFQPSPDLDLSIQNDGTTLDFTGTVQVDYCSPNKTMINVYYDPDDEDTDTI